MFCRNKKNTPSFRAKGRRRAGFTFIELIIAMVLLSVVMTLLYSSFSQISNNAKGLTDQLTEQQELRLLMKLVSDDLQAARYFENFAASQEKKSGILAKMDRMGEGDFSNVSFHSATQTRFFRKVSDLADPYMHEISYWVRAAEDKDKFQLMRREDFFLDDDMEEGGESTVLSDGMEVFKIEFLPHSEAGKDQERWEETWDSNEIKTGERLPVAIRITMARTTSRGQKLSQTEEFNLVIGKVVR